MVVAALGLGACAIPIEDEVGSQAQALRELDDVEAEFLMHMNEHRAMNGEAPVVDDFALNEGARDYSQVMGERNHFDHTGPDGSHFAERMCDSGYDPACGPSTFVGENIAAGNADAWSTFEQWRNSPGHNRNMLDGRYRVVGIGRAEVAGSRYRVYWTNTFAGQVTDTANEGEPPPEPMVRISIIGMRTGRPEPVFVVQQLPALRAQPDGGHDLERDSLAVPCQHGLAG